MVDMSEIATDLAVHLEEIKAANFAGKAAGVLPLMRGEFLISKLRFS